MTECERLEKLLPGYSDGSLDARERRLVERHLGECPDCRRLLDLLGATEKALAGFPRIEVSPALRRKLYALPARVGEKAEAGRAAGARAEERLGFFPRLFRQPVFVPAAVILFAVTLFATNPHRDQVLRALNRQVHLGVNSVEKVYAQAGSLLDKLKDYKEGAVSTLKSMSSQGESASKKQK